MEAKLAGCEIICDTLKKHEFACSYFNIEIRTSSRCRDGTLKEEKQKTAFAMFDYRTTCFMAVKLGRVARVRVGLNLQNNLLDGRWNKRRFMEIIATTLAAFSRNGCWCKSIFVDSWLLLHRTEKRGKERKEDIFLSRRSDYVTIYTSLQEFIYAPRNDTLW